MSNYEHSSSGKSTIPLWEQSLYIILTFVLGYLIGTFSTLALRHAIEDRQRHIAETVATRAVEQMKHHCCENKEANK